MVPASQVVAMIQRTLCLLGNASKLISQTRRSKILEVIDKSWGKFGTEKFQATLFGEEIQTNLPTKVEKDVALSKTVSILKRNRKGKETAGPSSHCEGQFLRRGPPTKYGGGQGRNQSPYTSHKDTSSRNNQGDQGGGTHLPIRSGTRDFTSQDSHQWKPMRKCTKRSSETLRLLATLQTPECGHLSGPSFGSGRSNASCRWSSPVLLSKLGKNLTRPLDLGHSPRLQAGSLIQPSPKQRATCAQPGGRQSRSPQSGIREASGQGSHRTNVTGASHVRQPDVCRTQIRRVMETSHKFPASEQTCTNRTLQDGVNSVSKGSHTGRGLDGETRPEGCLPIADTFFTSIGWDLKSLMQAPCKNTHNNC